jgi:hypothetical protein
VTRISVPVFRLELTSGQRRQIRRVLALEASALELSLPDLVHLCTRPQGEEVGGGSTAPRASQLQLRLTREHAAVRPPAPPKPRR